MQLTPPERGARAWISKVVMIPDSPALSRRSAAHAAAARGGARGLLRAGRELAVQVALVRAVLELEREPHHWAFWIGRKLNLLLVLRNVERKVLSRAKNPPSPPSRDRGECTSRRGRTLRFMWSCNSRRSRNSSPSSVHVHAWRWDRAWLPAVPPFIDMSPRRRLPGSNTSASRTPSSRCPPGDPSCPDAACPHPPVS